MRRKLGSLMCLNNTYESQVDWFANFHCSMNSIYFLYYNCWNFNHNFHSYCWLFLLSSSIASSSLLCNINAVHLLTCKWKGRYYWSHSTRSAYADGQLLSNNGKGMKASSQNLSGACKAWIWAQELQMLDLVNTGQPMPDWKNELSLQSFWDKTV